MRHKKITAGRLVREGVWTTARASDAPKARAERCHSTKAAQQRMNDKTSWQKLMMMLATNFTATDLVVTLTYDDDHLPETVQIARARLKRFFAVLRKHRKAKGQELGYIYCTEHLHTDGRIHHHVVLNGTGEDFAIIRQLWCFGSDIEFDIVDTWGYEELAKYMTKEAREVGRAKVGDRTWVCAKGLKKPDVEHQWVPSTIRLQPPVNAYVLQREEKETEFGYFAYVVYMLPDLPKKGRVRPRK